MRRSDPNHPEPDRLRDEEYEREHTADTEAELSLVIDLPDGGKLSFDTLAEAAEAGYPVVCQWFAGCEGEATTLVSHPALLAVPTCAKHAAWVAANR